MKNILPVFGAVAGLTMASGALAQPFASLPPPLVKEGVTQKIAEHVYVIPDFDVALVPNITIVVGTRGTLVVDTGLTVHDRAAALKRAGKTVDETVRTLQEELQPQYNRNQMVSAVRAAYNEAQ